MTPRQPLSSGQKLAIEQLRSASATRSGGLRLLVEPADCAFAQSAHVEISLDCSRTRRTDGGLALRDTERFTLFIDAHFPFSVPKVCVRHRRWADYPHVQWGHELCLYASPSTEWNPSDGMNGLIERLTIWLERSAKGQLDQPDQPLHPPVAYTSPTREIAVVKKDLGELAPEPLPERRIGSHDGSARLAQLLVARCKWKTEYVFDVVEWCDLATWTSSINKTRLHGAPDEFGVLTVLANSEMTFEYPDNAGALMENLVAAGLDIDAFVQALTDVSGARIAARDGGFDYSMHGSLFIMVGTPSRRTASGTLRQHLVCWKLGELNTKWSELLGGVKDFQTEAGLSVKAEVEQHARDWLESKLNEIEWVQVMEARPEVTQRRDEGTAVSWLRGRRVLIYGAGALGGRFAEFCLRAGTSQVSVLDSGRVTPGILVRQPFDESQIGLPKSLALTRNLSRVYGLDKIEGVERTVQNSLIGTMPIDPTQFDLVIDATADASACRLIELVRRGDRANWPPLITAVVGHDARRGVATVTARNASGGGHDTLRKVSIATRTTRRDLQDIGDDIFPTEPRVDLFQPEPGCSSPTFTGSAAQMAALAGALFDAAIGVVAESPEDGSTMSAMCVRLDGRGDNGEVLPALTQLDWPDDRVGELDDSDYEVRIASQALEDMRAECSRASRNLGSSFETGGVLFGYIDDACGVVWVDSCSGPPRDSYSSPWHFDRGTEGVAELTEYHRGRSGRLTHYIGEWHTHPNGVAHPSPTDVQGMRVMVSGEGRRRILMVVGGQQELWNGWKTGSALADMHSSLFERNGEGFEGEIVPPPKEHLQLRKQSGYTKGSDEWSRNSLWKTIVSRLVHR